MSDRKEGLRYDDEFIDSDAAPVAADLAYKSRRLRWQMPSYVDHIQNSEKPVARLRWPKRRDKKEFFKRLAGSAA